MELTRQNETHAANASYSEPSKYREELPLNCSREGHHIRREILQESNSRLYRHSTFILFEYIILFDSYVFKYLYF